MAKSTSDDGEKWKELKIELRLEAHEFVDNKIYGIVEVKPETSRALIKEFKLWIDDLPKVSFNAEFRTVSVAGFDPHKQGSRSVILTAIPRDENWKPEVTYTVKPFSFIGYVFALSPVITFEKSEEEHEKEDKIVMVINWDHIGNKKAQKYIINLDNKAIKQIHEQRIDDHMRIRVANMEPETKHTLQHIAVLSNGKETCRSDLIEVLVPRSIIPTTGSAEDPVGFFRNPVGSDTVFTNSDGFRPVPCKRNPIGSSPEISVRFREDFDRNRAGNRWKILVNFRSDSVCKEIVGTHTDPAGSDRAQRNWVPKLEPSRDPASGPIITVLNESMPLDLPRSRIDQPTEPSTPDSEHIQPIEPKPCSRPKPNSFHLRARELLLALEKQIKDAMPRPWDLFQPHIPHQTFPGVPHYFDRDVNTVERARSSSPALEPEIKLTFSQRKA